MLSVGRELNIRNNSVVCHACSWEGSGAELAAALIRVTSASIYLYVYRCPRCAGVELARKGKLLQFRLPTTIAEEAEKPAKPKREHAMP